MAYSPLMARIVSLNFALSRKYVDVNIGKATAAVIIFTKAIKSVLHLMEVAASAGGIAGAKDIFALFGLSGLSTVIPLIVATVAAITALVYIVDKLHHSTAELAQELQGLDNEIDSSQSEIDEYKSKIAENDKQIQELQDTINKVGGLVETNDAGLEFFQSLRFFFQFFFLQKWSSQLLLCIKFLLDQR